MSDCLPTVEIRPKEKADAAIIWLHGLGADGHDFEGVAAQLDLPDTLNIHYIFPHAPQRAITINNNMVMPAWFDILELGKERSFNSSQFLESAAEVTKLLNRAIENGIPSERVILAGFSQGGAVCYHAALSFDKPLAGLMALSTWFPSVEMLDIHPSNAAIPIEIYHGTEDPVLPVSMAENSKEYLQAMGLAPEFYTYPMPHSVCAEELTQISTFIRSVLV